MAHQVFFSVAFLFFLTLVCANNPSPFDFIKEFEGVNKGESVTGLNRVKSFLNQFGYLDYCHPGDQACVMEMDDEYDDSLEAALKTYQLNYRLNPTGALDIQTVTAMMMLRCGVPDIINGLNSMQIGENNDKSSFPEYPKWPAFKSNLTYLIPSNTSAIAVRAIKRALKKWADATHFRFSQTRDFNIADLKISFHTTDHGDSNPFDGPGGIVSHAWGPLNGIFHLDGDEPWYGSVLGGLLDLETVALHGIGHLLGLGHSSVEDAIMYPSFALGKNKSINGHDMEVFKSLYNE